MINYIFIAIGSALGGISRFWLTEFIARRWGDDFPVGTLIVNVTGSFLVGFIAALTGIEGPARVTLTTKNFFIIGICGGYTTFSSFSLRTVDLARTGQWLYASANVLLSVTLCLSATLLGLATARLFHR
jgi:CrcB protein